MGLSRNDSDKARKRAQDKLLAVPDTAAASAIATDDTTPQEPQS
jgi:hypothetical protein